MSEVTKILEAVEAGDTAAAERLLPIAYDELRRIAASKMANQRAGHTLQPTALVHEAYLRLLGPDGEQVQWSSRGHFFMAAAEAMRRILIESIRRKQALKRGAATWSAPLGTRPTTRRRSRRRTSSPCMKPWPPCRNRAPTSQRSSSSAISPE